MARHRIGPEQRWGERPARSIGASLDEVLALVGWAELDELLAGISSSSKGESGWPPLALFRALLAAVMRQRDARGVVVRTGTLVDTALIPSASTKDEQARWAGHRRRKPVHGYKAHVATDQDAGLIGGVEITTANKHDASELEAILPDAPGDTDGDSAHQGNRPKGIIRARGGRPRIVHKGGFGGAAAEERLRVYNAEVRRVRCRIEKVFGTTKRSHGLRQMRWLGLAKAGLQVRLTAIAHNLRCALTLFAPTVA